MKPSIKMAISIQEALSARDYAIFVELIPNIGGKELLNFLADCDCTVSSTKENEDD